MRTCACTEGGELVELCWACRFKGSSFYSLAREAGDIECAYLNGEMVSSLSSLPKAFGSTNGVAFRRCLEGFTAC